MIEQHVIHSRDYGRRCRWAAAGRVGAAVMVSPVRCGTMREARLAVGHPASRYGRKGHMPRIGVSPDGPAPGTYATTSTDVPLAPSGFAAVGRHALPSDEPASHRFV